MAHKTDSGIPQLVNLEGLARLAGLPRPQVNIMYQSGFIPGAEVDSTAVGGGTGRAGVVFQPKVAKLLKKNPHPSAPAEDPKIPALVTSEVVARLWGLTRQAVDRKFRTGAVPGVVVNNRLLFRLDAVLPKPERMYPTGEARVDEEIPELVDAAGAAEILGVNITTVKNRYRAGQLPGAEPDVGDRQRLGGWVFRKELVEKLKGTKLESRPARDPGIPELVSTGKAAEMLGGGSNMARRLNEKGLLPGRLVRGTPDAPQRMVFRKELVGQQAPADED